MIYRISYQNIPFFWLGLDWKSKLIFLLFSSINVSKNPMAESQLRLCMQPTLFYSSNSDLSGWWPLNITLFLQLLQFWLKVQWFWNISYSFVSRTEVSLLGSCVRIISCNLMLVLVVMSCADVFTCSYAFSFLLLVHYVLEHFSVRYSIVVILTLLMNKRKMSIDIACIFYIKISL